MTLPINPGPWAFLADAGQAAGAIGASVEERKRHGEELAYRSSLSIMQQLLNGADPKILDDPAIQSVFQKGLGVKVNSQLYAAVGAPARLAGATANAESAAGLPAAAAAGEVAWAKAEVPQAELARKGAQAQLDANVPQLSADAAAAQALATKSGAQLNASVYDGARALLGTDPQFAKLSYESATGALDAKFRTLQFQRYSMSLDRQRMVEDGQRLHEISIELAKSYDADVASWRKEMDAETALITDPQKKQKAQAAYMAANPPPDRDESYARAIKSYGFTLDQFQQAYRKSMSDLFGPGGLAENTPTTPPAGSPKSPGPNPVDIVNRALTGGTNGQPLDPKQAANALADLLRTNSIGGITAKVVQRSLRLQAPGDWYRAFNQAFLNQELPTDDELNAQ